MKKRLILIALLAALLCVCLYGCSQSDEHSGVKVVFNLEGGLYKNSSRPVTYYYNYEGDGTWLIQSPDALTDTNVQRDNYELVGWFRTKTVNGSEVTYSDEWDFSTDKVDKNGVELYACWKKQVKYSYRVCYRDENDEVVVIGTYDNVKQGQVFSDFNGYGSKRSGYTLLGFVDEQGNPWDSSFTHPGGDTDTAISVFCNYVKGKYKIVSTATEFTKYFGKESIYLTADIDLGGVAIAAKAKLNGRENSHIVIEGNGHTVSNLKIKAGTSPVGGFSKNDLLQDVADENEQALYACLFAEASFADVRNITFTDISVEVNVNSGVVYNKLYVAPFAASATNCTFTEVTMDFTVSFKTIVAEEQLVVADKLFAIGDTTQQNDACSVSVTTEYN